MADFSWVSMERPSGVTAIAVLFFLAVAYLGVVGGTMLLWPGLVPMAAGAPLLGGLELAGPWMFLLVGGVAALIAWGLLRLNRWARRAAIAIAMIGVVLLVPTVSAAADFRGALFWAGLGIILRVMVIWYLWQEPVKEEFGK